PYIQPGRWIRSPERRHRVRNATRRDGTEHDHRHRKSRRSRRRVGCRGDLELHPGRRRGDQAGIVRARLRRGLSGLRHRPSEQTACLADDRPVWTSSGAVRTPRPFDDGAADAFAPIYQSLFVTGLLLLVALIPALLLSIFFARRMVRPIQTLHAAAAKIGSGTWDQRIDIRTGDELEELAETFNQMAARLRD